MSSAFASEAEIAAIAAGVRDLSLPKSQWSHAAHFAAALALIRQRGLALAAREMPGLIRAYNQATGVPNTDADGYHETITQASLRAAAAFLAGFDRRTPLHDVCNALMTSPLGKSSWLLDYWSRPVLFSTAARRAWVDPDLRDLPF